MPVYLERIAVQQCAPVSELHILKAQMDTFFLIVTDIIAQPLFTISCFVLVQRTQNHIKGV